MKTLIKTSLTGLFLLAGCFVTEETTTIKIIDPIIAIDADIDSGLISLQPSLDGTIVIERTLRFSNRPPIASSLVVDGVLQLRGECSFGFGVCDVNYIVRTPPEVSVQINTDSGDIEVRDLVGPLTLRAASGNIEASGASQSIDAQTDSGDVTIEEITGNVTVDVSSGNLNLRNIIGDSVLSVDSGDVSLSSIQGDIDVDVSSGNVTGDTLSCNNFSASLDSGDLTVDMFGAVQQFFANLSSGNIVATLPFDSYQVEVQTSFGDATITNLINDPTAAKTISVSTDSGDIVLQGR
jgi:hypothetical protein